jgi:hypothetical protein
MTSDSNRDLSGDRLAPPIVAHTQNEMPSGRRRFLTTGLVGGSVILLTTTKAVPTLASGGCVQAGHCTFSGMMSGNSSAHPQSNGCGGFSPGYYKMPSHWPSAYTPGSCKGKPEVCTGGTTFFSVFGTAPDKGTSSDTMLQVLVTEEPSLAFHYVAALLNSVNNNLPSGITYPYQSSDIVKFWHSSNRSAFSTFLNQNLENC